MIRKGRLLLGVTSPEGETLNFLEPVNLEDVSLPQWLNNLEEEMRKTLKYNLEQCLIDSRADPSEYPTQVRNTFSYLIKKTTFKISFSFLDIIVIRKNSFHRTLREGAER